MADKVRVGIIGLGGISYAHEAGYGEMGGSMPGCRDVRYKRRGSK